jgi:hypothetical protein
MKRKLELSITLVVGLLVVGFALVLTNFSEVSSSAASGNVAPAPVVLLSAEEPLEGSFTGEVELHWGLTGVLSNTLQTPTPIPTAVGGSNPYTSSMEADLGGFDLGLLVQQSGMNITAYIDLDQTLVFTGEHTIQATPVGPTPFPGTPALGVTPLPVGPKLTGTFDGTTMNLRSEVLNRMIGGKSVRQQFELIGVVERPGNLITFTGEYRETIWGYMPQPVTVLGAFVIYQVVFNTVPENTPTTIPTNTPVTPGAPTSTPIPTNTPVTPGAPTSTPIPTNTPVTPGAPTPTATATAEPNRQIYLPLVGRN